MKLKHLTETFCNNGYPLAIIKNTMEKIEDGILSDRKDDNESDRQVLLTLPYKGPEGASRLRGMKHINIMLYIKRPVLNLHVMLLILEKQHAD